MSQDEARRVVRRAVEAHENGRVAFARKAKLDPGTLGDFLDGRHWPQARTRNKIEKALGWPSGRISDLADGIDPSNSGVVDAIRADTRLLPEARNHLLNQYHLLLRLTMPAETVAELEASMRADIEAERKSVEDEGTPRSSAKRR